MASREGQSSMMDWNDAKSVIANPLRQLVLKGKDNLSADVGIIQRHNVLMSRPQPDSQFKSLFLARTALAREKAGYTQESMAEALGMEQSKYSKYEVRTELPHHLIIPFCSLCDVSPAWLFTAVVEAREPRPRRRRSRQRVKAA
jgi:helix-turn-helix protein